MIVKHSSATFGTWLTVIISLAVSGAMLTARAADQAAGSASNEIIVTASRIARDIQSEPSAAYSLNGDENTLGDPNRTMPDVLEGIPSAMVQKTSYGQASPYLRGFTGFRTLCMIDGIRLNNSVFRDGPNQYWSTVDPLSIEGYELVMGPGSVLYGSDAVGGVLNAFPASAPEWAGEAELDGRLSYRYSTAEESSTGRAQVGGRLNEWIGFTGGYSIKDFGDLRGGHDVGVQEKTGYGEQDFNAELTCDISKDSSLALGHQSVSQEDAWRAHKTIYGVDWEGVTHGTDRIHSYDQTRDLSYMRYEAANMGGIVNGLKVTFSRQEQQEDLYRMKSDYTSERQGFDVETWGGSVQLESGSDMGSWVYGIECYRDQVDSYGRKYAADGSLKSTEIQGPVADDATYDTIGAFVQDTIPCFDGRFDVTPGVRYTFAGVDAGKYKDPVSGKAASLMEDWENVAGSLRILLPVTEERRHSVYANVSQGFRAPNLSDLTRFDSARSNEKEIPAPDLDPERYIAYEIGLKSRVAKFVSQLSYYYTSIDDMIIRTPTGETVMDADKELTVVTKENAGAGYVQGVELSETYHFTEQWSTWLTASLMDGKVDTYPTSSAEPERDYISRLMPPTAEIGCRWQSAGEKPKYWCELVGNAAAKADKLSADDERDTDRIPAGGTPGYAVFHVRTGAQLTKALNMNVALENILDEDYRTHGSGVNEPGRNLIVTAVYMF